MIRKLCKKINCIAFAGIISASALQAQKITFPLVWKATADNKCNFLTTCSRDGNEIVATTQKAVCVLNGKDGSKIWSGDLKTIAGLKDSDTQWYMEDAGMIFIFNKKMGADQLLCLDSKTGKVLWQTEKYQGVSSNTMIYIPELSCFGIYLKEGLDMIDAQTGNLKWSVTRFRGAIAKSCYFTDSKELLLLNYKPMSLAALFSGFKNQMMLINAQTGEVKWETQYPGIVETKIVTGKPLVDWQFSKDKSKIFLQLFGLKVFDFKTGQLMWKADLNESLSRGFDGSTVIYDAVADPLITNDAVYLADFSEIFRQKQLKKYDLETGKLLWESEQIGSRKTIIPQLAYVNGMIVAQLGGYVNVQSRKYDSKTGVTTSISKWKWQGPFGLQAFDASTGKAVWKSEKFKGRITNLIDDNKNLYVGSEKMFYKLDPKTGTAVYEIDIKVAKVGAPKKLLSFEGKIVTLCDKGVCAYKNADGSIIYTSPVKALSDDYDVYGNNYFLKSKSEIFAYDFNTGKISGSYKFDSKFKWKITKDGNFMYLFKKGAGDITKYKLN